MRHSPVAGRRTLESRAGCNRNILRSAYVLIITLLFGVAILVTTKMRKRRTSAVSDPLSEEGLLLAPKGVYTTPRSVMASAEDVGVVPKIIWQTAKSHDAPPAASAAAQSWSSKNPAWDRYVLDDAEVDAFVAQNYEQRVLDVFRKLPLGVMRADLFRYMMIYQRGGLYADIDTTCLERIETWVRPDCKVVLGLENHIHFCQWAFAAAARHDLLQRVVNRTLDKLLSGPVDTSNPHFVHAYTGPAIFTDAILEYLNWPAVSEETPLNVSLEKRGAEALKDGICIVSNHTLNAVLRNYYASTDTRFHTASWGSWVKDREALVSRGAPSSSPIR